MSVFYLGEASRLSDPQMWALIGLAVMGLIYMAVVRPMMRRRRDPLDRPPAFASLSQQRSVERQMQNLLVELSEMTRQVTAQLDTRAARLDALIKEADQKIRALQAMNNGKYLEPSSISIPSVGPDAVDARTSDSRHGEVYALADEGREPAEIAAQLGRPRGEVELILALRRGADDKVRG